MNNAKYAAALKKIELLSVKYKQQMQPPITKDQGEELRKQSVSRLGALPPDEYTEFLSIHNGLDWDGLSIYASTRTNIVGHTDREIGGFIEENLSRRAVTRWGQILVFGDTGDECYCLDLAHRRFCSIDAVSVERLEEYESFGDMIREAFEKRA